MSTAFNAPARSRLGDRWFAWLWKHMQHSVEGNYTELKQALFAELEGHVVEIGPGGGINLGYFPSHVRVTGVEPNPFMHGLLREAAEHTGHALEIREGHAEALPLEDATADAVVSTLVLCSVHSPERVIAEIHRVLRPGGKFYFIEHVAAPKGERRRAVQDWIAPFWRKMGDGCHPNRETWRHIEEAGFSDVRLDHRRFKMPYPVRPHIVGVAVK